MAGEEREQVTSPEKYRDLPLGKTFFIIIEGKMEGMGYMWLFGQVVEGAHT